MTESPVTSYGAAPLCADWYYCAVVGVLGETGYVDGYADGGRPTVESFLAYSVCDHSWVAGMMHIHPEDIETVAASGRPMECKRCGVTYLERDNPRHTILRFTASPTPQGAYAHMLADCVLCESCDRCLANACETHPLCRCGD